MTEIVSQPAAQIVVNPSSSPAVTEALVGQMLPLVGGMIAAAGHFDRQDTISFLGAGIALVSAGWRMWKAWDNHRKLKITADAAPDAVAIVAKKGN